MYLGGAVDGESGVSVEAGHAGHVDDAACKRERRREGDATFRARVRATSHLM